MTPEEALTLEPEVEAWTPPPIPPPPLEQFIGSEEFKNAPIDIKMGGINNWFSAAAPFDETDAHKERAWNTRMSLTDRVLSDYGNESIVKHPEISGRTGDDARAHQEFLTEYFNRTGGLTRDPDTKKANGEDLPPLRPLETRQLTDFEIDEISTGRAKEPNLFPSDKQRLEGATDSDWLKTALDASSADGASASDGAITKRDPLLEKKFKPYFDTLKERQKLWHKKGMAEGWRPVGELQDEDGVLAHYKVKKDASSQATTFQVNLGGGKKIEEIRVPDGMDPFSEEGGAFVQKAIQDKVRENIEVYSDDDGEWGTTAPLKLSSRKRVENIVGRKEYGFYGAERVSDAVARSVFPAVHQLAAGAVNLIAKQIDGPSLAETGAAVASDMIGRDHDWQKESPLFEKPPIGEGNPVSDWANKASVGLNEQIKKIKSSVTLTEGDIAMGNNWFINQAGSFDPAGFAAKVAGIGPDLAKMSLGPVGMASFYGQASDDNFGVILDEQMKLGKSLDEATKIATQVAPVAAAVQLGAMSLQMKLLPNQALESTFLRNLVTNGMAKMPGKADSILKRYFTTTAASLPGQAGSNAALNGISELATNFIYDMQIPGSDRMKAARDLFGKDMESWENFTNNPLIKAAGEGAIFGTIFGSGMFAHLHPKTPTVNGVEPPLGPIGPRMADGSFRNSFESGGQHVVLANDGRMVRFADMNEAESFHQRMTNNEAQFRAMTSDGTDGTRVWNDDVPEDVRKSVEEKRAAIQREVQENVMLHAIENGSPTAIAMHDSIRAAMEHARELASRLVFSDSTPIEQQRKATADVLADRYVEEGGKDGMTWAEYRKSLIESHGTRSQEWPASRQELEVEILDLQKQIAGLSKPEQAVERGKLQRQLTEAQSKFNKIKPIVKSYDPKIVEKLADEQINLEKQEMRTEGPLRDKANRQADEIYNPPDDLLEGLAPLGGVTAGATTPKLAAVLNKAFTVERKTYTGRDGVERVGYELSFRGPTDPASREGQYVTKARLAANEGARQIAKARAEAEKLAAEADASTNKLALEILGRNAERGSKPLTPAPEPISGVTPEGTMRRYGAAAGAKPETSSMGDYGESSRGRFKQKPKKAPTKLRTAEVEVSAKPDEAPLPIVEANHAAEVVQASLDAAAPKALQNARKQAKKAPQKPVKPAKSEAPLKSEKEMSEDLKTLKDFAKMPDMSEADLVDHLNGFEKTELESLAQEMGVKTKSAKMIARKAIEQFRKNKETESTFKSDEAADELAPTESDMTIDDLIAAEDAQSTDTKGGMTNLGKKGRSDAGSTIIFSEVANRAVTAIKAGWNSAKFVAESVKEWGAKIAKAAKQVWDHVVRAFSSGADDIANDSASKRMTPESEPTLPPGFEDADPVVKKYMIRKLMTPEQRKRVDALDAEIKSLVQKGQLTEASYESMRKAIQSNPGAWKWYEGFGVDWWKAVAARHPELGKGAQALAHYELAFNGRFISELNADNKGLIKELRPRGVFNPNGLRQADYDRLTLHWILAPESVPNLINTDPAYAKIRDKFGSWAAPDVGARDSIHRIATENGVDLGMIENYLPRVVTDVAGLQKWFRDQNHPDQADVSNEIAEATKGMGPGTPEYADAIDKLILGRITTTPRSSAHTKSRSVEMDINDPRAKELIKFYAGPDMSLERYVNRMARNITIQRFFGSDAKSTMATGAVDVTGGGTTIPKSSKIGGVMDDLIARGELSPDQQSDVIKLFGDYLNAKPSNRAVRVLKALSTPLVLNNPINAVRQLEGLSRTAILNGAVNTFDGIVNIPEAQRLTMKNQGMLANIQLHSADAALPQFTEAVWSMSMYRAMDSIEGNAYMNSRILQLGRMSDADAMDILNPYQRFLDKPVDQVLGEIRSGKWLGNRDVEYIAFGELSNVRPTSLASQPVALMQGGSAAKIAYHLKLFTIQRFNFLREQALAHYKSGDYVGGAAKMGALIGAAVTANAGIDEITDFIFGRVGGFKDHVTDQLLKILPGNLSNFTADKLAQGNFKDTALGLVSIPAIDFADAAAKTVAKAKKSTEVGDPWFTGLGDSKLFKFIPSLGASQFYYSRFGGGVEARERSFAQAYSKNVQKDVERYNALEAAGKDKRKKNNLDLWFDARKKFMDIKQDADKIAKWHMKNNDITQAINIANHLSAAYEKPETWDQEATLYRQELRALKVREKHNPGTGIK